ncbi:DUF4296 domain-containing protein [Flavobacterium sp.]|uniref:DUF4296 domain-containing protein n=1 Tax=Flavobacterium sp. TaxID=239 RepID=UPI0035B3830B
MKKLALIIVLFVFSCQNNGVEKPDNLIEKDKMVDILYDVSLLEAVRSQGINGGVTNKEINDFVKRKYNVDSTQFVKSNRYYAADVEEYKEMYEKIKTRVDEELKKADQTVQGVVQPSTSPNSTQNSDTPKVY